MGRSTEIGVACERHDSDWLCVVDLRDADGPTSHHRVTVAADVLARLAPGTPDPEDLVHRSFEFLLAREPKESILASFDLTLIGHYFPEYERTIGRRR